MLTVCRDCGAVFRVIKAGLLTGSIALLMLSPGVQALTADELVAKNIQARGGAEKLQAIHSAKANGILSFTGDFGANLNFTTWQSGGMIRQDASLQGLTVV